MADQPVTDQLAQPVPLYRAEGGDPVVWLCGSCKRVCLDEEGARSCYYCVSRTCKCSTSIPAPSIYTACRPCRDESRRVAELDRAAKAEQVPEADHGDGPVCWSDSYYRSLSELIDMHTDEELAERPIWACTEHRPEVDLAEVLQQVEESIGPFEDEVEICWSGVAWLQKAVDKFNKQQSSRWWEEDNSRTVVLEVPRG